LILTDTECRLINVICRLALNHAHRTYLLVGMNLFLYSFAFSQIFPYESYTVKDGLPSNTITVIRQDSRGYIWIGTNNGLSMYDGNRFTTYTSVDGLSNNWITDIQEDPLEAGTLWIGTFAGGVNNLRKGHFTTFHTGNDNVSNSIQAINIDSSGTVWVKTYARIYRLERDSLSEIKSPLGLNDTTSAISFANNSLWLSNGNKLFCYNRRTSRWVLIHSSTDSDVTVTCTTPCKTGGLWVGWSNGRISLARGTGIIRSLSTRQGRPYAIVDDGTSHLWVHTGKVILHVSTSGGGEAKVIPLLEGAEYPVEHAPSMMIDHENNLWFGTWTKGLAKLSDRNLYHIHVGEHEKTSPPSGAVADSSGHIWTGVRGGILELYEDSFGVWQQFFHPLLRTSPETECYVSLSDRFGALWVTVAGNSSIQGYTILPQHRKQSRIIPGVKLDQGKHYPEGPLLMLFVDTQNRMYVSIGKAGVAVIDLKQRMPLGTITATSGSPGLAVRAIVQDHRGIIWMGGWNDGISLLDPGTPLPTLLKKYGIADGLPDNSIRSFYEDRERTMWVGTRYGGIARLEGKTFETASMNNGLMSNAIWGIDGDEYDRLYLWTDVGIERLDRRTMKPVSQKQELLDQGVSSFGILQRRFLWYTSRNELTVYEYPLASANTVPPPTHISSFQANGKVVDPGAPISLAFNENNCVIEYDGISYKNAKAVRYQYRLLGATNNWTAPTAQRSVTFATLEPGFYTFEVVAINAEGIHSTAPASVSFTIVPPYWQRWWFLTLVLCAVAMILFFLYRYRVARLLEMANLRTRIAADLHDDVGTNLSTIVVASQIMERQASLPPKERSQLKEIGLIATTTQEMMRDIVWMLNPKNDSLDDFVLKMKEVASQLLQDIRYTFVVPEERLLDKVSVEFKRNVFLIFKESLNNIVRHSFASEVSIVVKQESGRFTLQIGDNGRGFEVKQSFQGSGLANIGRRATQLGGVMDVESAAGNGTTITLTVKNDANA